MFVSYLCCVTKDMVPWNVPFGFLLHLAQCRSFSSVPKSAVSNSLLNQDPSAVCWFPPVMPLSGENFHSLETVTVWQSLFWQEPLHYHLNSGCYGVSHSLCWWPLPSSYVYNSVAVSSFIYWFCPFSFLPAYICEVVIFSAYFTLHSISRTISALGMHSCQIFNLSWLPFSASCLILVYIFFNKLLSIIFFHKLKSSFYFHLLLPSALYLSSNFILFTSLLSSLPI